MKKQINTTAIALFGVIVLFSSCKKDYSCSCSGTGTSNNITYEVSSNYTYEKTKKDDAQSKCTANQATLSEQNGGITVTCAIAK